MTELSRFEEVIYEAGHRLLEMTAYNIEEKGDYKNIVTSCDENTQKFLIERLSKLEPEATFLCEESDQYDVSGQHVFIIDPIDGTTNFVKGYNQSAISVAYADHKDIIWGIVYNPYSDEFFEAYKGKGAYLNGKSIHVTDQALKTSLVSFGTSPYYEELRNESFGIACKVMEYCMDIRRSGSAALDLCYVASGRTGLYFERILSPWDFAAGMCIVNEAGGKVVNWDNDKPDYVNKSGIVAGNDSTVEEFANLFL